MLRRDAVGLLWVVGQRELIGLLRSAGETLLGWSRDRGVAGSSCWVLDLLREERRSEKMRCPKTGAGELVVMVVMLVLQVSPWQQAVHRERLEQRVWGSEVVETAIEGQDLEAVKQVRRLLLLRELILEP